MDSTFTSVLAALGGSLIGTSPLILSNVKLQRALSQRELTNREVAQREELDAEFISLSGAEADLKRSTGRGGVTRIDNRAQVTCETPHGG